MKDWFAEVVMCGVNLLCALTNHAGGCLVWRALWWPYCWAADVFAANREYTDRHDCPVCAKAKPGVSGPSEWEIVDDSVRTVGSGGTVVVRLQPRRQA